MDLVRELIGGLYGRHKIYTNEAYVDASNVVQVVAKGHGMHKFAAAQMQYLIDYERGMQPLQREKIVRPEIDIKVEDNLANMIKELKASYFWGQPAMIVQRSDVESPESDAEMDGKAIAKLNSLMVNNVHVGYQDQKIADFVEISGIGHRMIDIASRKDRSGLPFRYYTLDSRFTFVIYHNGIGEEPLVAVTYTKVNNDFKFTAYTAESRFDIENGKIVSQQANLLGMIPIVEYERAIDRMGCFERLVSALDALNIMVSDATNDVAQHTQEIWWSNDVSFTDPKTGENVVPKSGQWVQTFTGGEGNHPNIKPLSSTLNQPATLQMINNERTHILEKAKVPIQYSSEGGGSTGVAMDISSGWSAAEADALRQQQLVDKAKREELELICRAIQLAPSSVLPENDILRNIRPLDCDFHYNRRKNYDMAVKANTFATYVSHGLHGRHALKEIDAFGDVEQVWNDSKDLIEAYQKATFLNSAKEQIENDRIMQDSSDQVSQSPIIDGMNTDRSQVMT